MQTGVLDMVRSNRLLSFDLHTYVHPDGSWHSRLISSLVCQMKVRYTRSLVGWNLFNLQETSTSIICFLFCYLCVTSCSSHPSLILHRLFSYLENSPRLYQTSISPLRVRTSIMVWPRKSSLSRLNLCFTRDLMSSSSSHTRTLMRSDELWHSLGEAEAELVGKQQSATVIQRSKVWWWRKGGKKTPISNYHVVLWWSKNIKNGVSQINFFEI